MWNHVLAEEVLLLHRINEKIIRCTLCPRLIKHIREIGNTKTKSICTNLIGQSLFQLLVILQLKLLVIGLAPAANGGNRTGRIFTGDNSGWLACKGLI